jgi:hypothetical protein
MVRECRVGGWKDLTKEVESCWLCEFLLAVARELCWGQSVVRSTNSRLKETQRFWNVIWKEQDRARSGSRMNRIWQFLSMVYNTQNHWVCGLCLSFGILNNHLLTILVNGQSPWSQWFWRFRNGLRFKLKYVILMMKGPVSCWTKHAGRQSDYIEL